MAVITNTVWDLALAQQRGAEASAAVLTTTIISVRAAYQAHLYGRATVFRLAGVGSPQSSSFLPTVSGIEFLDWVEANPQVDVALLADDESTAHQFAAVLAHRRVQIVAGGTPEWRRSGLPV